MSCGYTGSEFGASYPDAICYEGDLWDLDSCEEPGGPLLSGGDIPCPNCNTKAYLDYKWFQPSGNARQRRKARRIAIAAIHKWSRL